ncbi:Uncharacterised protein [Escherichia coli]|nr:Uncharacterised protein [Escherichia coli]
MIIGIVGCGGIARAHVNALCLNPLVTGEPPRESWRQNSLRKR